mgnify:CR=1 FL=1
MTRRLVLSSDSHVVEPPHLWTERMDPMFGERIPHMVHEEPFDQFYCDFHPVGAIGGSSQAGKRFSKPEEVILAGAFADVPPGGYDPGAHLQDLDIDGVYADVLYPSIGLSLFFQPNTQFLRPVFSAYNDWLSHFCSTDPNRLKGIGMIVIDDDVESGINELKRCAEIGLCGAMISVSPRQGETYDQPIYDPFWATAQDLDIPLSLHVSTNRPGGSRTGVTTNGTDRSNIDYWVRMSLGHIIFSGVLDRFPRLKIVNVEHGLSWIPYYTQRMDDNYTDFHAFTPYRFKGSTLPSDFMRTNVFHSFQDDHLGIILRDYIGVDNILWASDYPHAESTFPKSQEILDKILEGVPENEVSKIVAENCAKLYGFSIDGLQQ